jgi:type I restriction enzyme S subunit
MLDSLRPHSAYIDSGEPWFGDIPAHWTVQRLKRCATRFYAGGTPDSGSADCYCTPPDGIPWLLIADMTRQRRVRTTTKAITERGRLSRRLEIIPKGTVLYSMYASLGASSILEIDATVNQAIIGIAPNSAVLDREYFLYALENLRRHINVLATSSTQSNLNAEKVKSLPIPLPPPAEQAGIVRFLGAVDRKVNRFIRAKRRLIEVLTEQKQAIITHAVTKGLNPAAPKKPSGIDWLGDVPEHWEVRKLRLLVDTLGGMTPSKADQSFWNGDVPWVSPKDMKSVEIVGSIDHITQAALAQTNIALIPSPAVLIVVRGMILARTFPVGVTTLPVTINQDMKALRPRNSSVGVNAIYLRHLLSGLGDVVKMLIEESGHGTRVLRTDLWRNLPLPVPPRSEQEAICEYISDQTTVFDQAASQARREIDLIREYRTRLVADVVTGKVDVRAAAAAIPDEAADPGPDPGAGEPGDDADPVDNDADGGADLEPALGAAGTEGEGGEDEA